MKRGHLFQLSTGELIWVTPPSTLDWHRVRSLQSELHKKLHADSVETWNAIDLGGKVGWIPAQEDIVLNKYLSYYQAISKELGIPLNLLDPVERHEFFISKQPQLVGEKWLLPSSGLEELLGVDYKPKQESVSAGRDEGAITGTGEPDLDIVADTCLMFGEKGAVANFLLEQFCLQEMIAILSHASKRQEQAQKEWDKKMKGDNKTTSKRTATTANTSRIQAPANIADSDFTSRRDALKTKLSGIPLPDDF